VWLARDEVLCRWVAVKEIAPPRGLTGQQLDRLGEQAFREARAAAQVDHPHVVKVYDIIHSGQWPLIVMQYVPSRSLLGVIRMDGPLATQYVARLGMCLVDALSAIHRAGVLHRDVTPQNVLLARDGRVMLTDFGLALWLDGHQPDEPMPVGTALYVAPERVVKGECTAAGDFWSLGATLYTAVEGRAPYARPSTAETLSALVSLPPDPPSCSGPLTTVLLSLLEREPRLRPTAAEARAMLVRAAAHPAEARAAKEISGGDGGKLNPAVVPVVAAV
jgi:serine/threonine protein kinase